MAEGSDSKKRETSMDSVNKPEPENIDSLLDSALDDFNQSSKEELPAEDKSQSDPTTGPHLEDVETMWSEMMKQALKMDPNIRDMFDQGSSEQHPFAQDFSKIAEAASKAIEDETELSQNNFAQIMAETLKNLQENSEAIQNQFGSPEDVANLFQQLGLNVEGESEGSFDNIPPFMQHLMQSFLSKDVLYPSIKDFVTRYPLWIEEHKDSLTEEQHQTYSEQLDLMRKVVEEFEAESDSDSEEVKKNRFQKIMEWMQQMQALGQPPAELINEGTLGEASMPSLPPGIDPNQCCTM